MTCARDAEVYDLDEVDLAAGLGEDQVGGLEVAVDDFVYLAQLVNGIY